jgi:hypothetical protein
MAVAFDLAPGIVGPTLFTGSMYQQGDSAGAMVTAPLQGANNLQTGSWPGLGNTWGATALLTGTLTGSLSEGTWWGIDYSWGTYLIPTESFDRTDPTSNQFPFPDQGLGEGDWNPFPIPPSPPEPILPTRDLTRYKKSYSASRHQPVRIRLVKS